MNGARPRGPQQGFYPGAGLLPGIGHLSELALEVVHLVTQTGGVLETEFGGGLVHFLFEALDQPAQIVGGRSSGARSRVSRTRRSAAGADELCSNSRMSETFFLMVCGSMPCASL